MPEASLNDIYLELASYNNDQNVSVLNITNDFSNVNIPSYVENTKIHENNCHPLYTEFANHRWITPHKGQWREALMFL